ncbi:MAG: methylated-DNA--[Desulfovibrio sp.]|nr:methylated-DNA--[protein]-cysteine S-methyltransferase [Desulfovibrio sp.]
MVAKRVKSTYQSPLGLIYLTADAVGLTEVWFEGTKNSPVSFNTEHGVRETPVIVETKRWLDIYFSGKRPDFTPHLHIIGTEFRLCVWHLLQQIPYGKTVCYGLLADNIAKKRGMQSMSAQAVGGAVSHNGISIIIPCHRVVGKNGHLIGYTGGIDRKYKLLQLEHAAIEKFFSPVAPGIKDRP